MCVCMKGKCTKDGLIVMNELLFEGYSVPSVVYGIDSLFSYYANNGTKDDGGIIISSGNTSTHIIPTIGDRGILSKTKRLVYWDTFKGIVILSYIHI